MDDREIVEIQPSFKICSIYPGYSSDRRRRTPFFSIRLQNRTTSIVFYDNAAKPFRNRSRNISCSFTTRASNGTSQIGWKVKVQGTILHHFHNVTFSNGMQLKILDYSCFRSFHNRLVNRRIATSIFPPLLFFSSRPPFSFVFFLFFFFFVVKLPTFKLDDRHSN